MSRPLSNEYKILNIDDFNELYDKFRELGFIDKEQLFEILDEGDCTETYGYIDLDRQAVVFGTVWLAYHEVEEQRMIAMTLDPECQVCDFVQLETDSSRYVRTDYNAYTYYNKDIELLHLIKNKYIQIYNDLVTQFAAGYFKDDIAGFPRSLYEQVYNYVKKLNRKSKHE